ncbi:MAG TPA: OmpH family outer membrane protein [Opitutaceae bacterium]|nr:OmpH family outer membrane protein [Opitutaceae bacterium]
MNRTLQSVITAIAFSATALGLSAQPALKIVTVDIGKIFDSHYKTEEQMAKLKDAQAKAQEELERMVKEANQLVEQYKETMDQSKNSLLTPEARSKAEGDSQKMMEDIQRRNADLQNFRATTQQSLQQRFNNFRSVLLDEISKKVTDLAKTKGATLVVDKSGPTLAGIPSVIYADAAYDITDEVMAAVNKDRPATAATPAPATATPAPATTTPAAAPVAEPTVTVPGLAPKK